MNRRVLNREYRGELSELLSFVSLTSDKFVSVYRL